ncbi:MAG: hypothetical protein ABJA66_18380 [Actinomycetota bacterium]
MKQTTTEIFIEIEETIYVKSAARKKSFDEETEDSKFVIEICPHCRQAVFETKVIEIKGDLDK